MPQLAAALPYITAAAAVATAAGSIMSGNAAASAGRFEAAQANQQAGQEKAAAQRTAIEQRRQAGLKISRVNALAAASGGGADDPSVLNLEKDLAGEGEYNALSALYQGDERARGLQMGAGAKLYEGAQAKQTGMISAGTSLLKAGGGLVKDNLSPASPTIATSAPSLFEKYGDGGFDSGLYPSYA